MVFVYSKTTCFSQNFSEVSPFFLIVFGVGLLKKGANWVQKNMRTFILQKKADVTRKKQKQIEFCTPFGMKEVISKQKKSCL